ncbi:MAG: CcmD family protein [Ignavibacteria bacterium]|nr:MAG: CcmD family protein [Ignavibacteria bacterium]
MEGLYSFFENNSIYIVMVILLVVWIGIYVSIWSTDNRLKAIEKELKESKNEE